MNKLPLYVRVYYVLCFLHVVVDDDDVVVVEDVLKALFLFVLAPK
jgi:hypothetical protein